jgi:tRNA(fMet)-specific endonuclease VapC
MTYFLDTNICIYYLNGKYPNILKEIKNRNPKSIKIASIVKAELLYGAEKSAQKKINIDNIEKFLTPYELVNFDDISAQVYSIIRVKTEVKGRTVVPNDLIVASTVIAHGGILVTNNEKEFRKIENLVITNWAK